MYVNYTSIEKHFFNYTFFLKAQMFVCLQLALPPAPVNQCIGALQHK